MHKALIIEDNNHSREILKQQLKHLGYRVVEATDGLEGLKLAKEEKPDIVILDIMMAEKMDGREVARKLRMELKMHDLPILAATVLFHRDEIQSCLDAGCNDVLRKPFSLKQLKEKLDRLSHLAGYQK